MKFVHIADMHFDIPFTTLAKNDLSNERRLEQRKVFKEIINYISQNNIDYLFICGDLYEHEYVKKSTIEYINNLFKEIPNTKIYIVPGNHDPIIKESYYNKFKWNSNVYIFNEKINKISEKETDIYGFGFNNFYRSNPKLEEIQIENPNKINILLTHTSLDASKKEELQYNPIQKSKLKELGFDYIALGHIHKPYYNEEQNQNIVYPGSPISLGFDEQGQHGMIVGQIEKGSKLEISFIPMDKKEFIEKELIIDNLNSQEEIIETINSINLEENKYYKIILKGKKEFAINKYEILKQIQNKNIIKIKDETSIKINLEELSLKNTLKGIFVKNMLEKIDNTNKEEILKAIQIGLDVM